jgi:hypothetical protein
MFLNWYPSLKEEEEKLAQRVQQKKIFSATATVSPCF